MTKKLDITLPLSWSDVVRVKSEAGDEMALVSFSDKCLSLEAKDLRKLADACIKAVQFLEANRPN